MDQRIVDALHIATHDIFSKMGSFQLQPGIASENWKGSPDYDFTGIIGLSGPVIGSVFVHITKGAAARVAGGLLGMDVDKESDEARETVGEMTNMIAGGMRNELSQFGIDFNISLPTVVSGLEHKAESTADTPGFAIPFTLEDGNFVVQVFIKPAANNV